MIYNNQNPDCNQEDEQPYNEIEESLFLHYLEHLADVLNGADVLYLHTVKFDDSTTIGYKISQAFNFFNGDITTEVKDVFINALTFPNVIASVGNINVLEFFRDAVNAYIDSHIQDHRIYTKLDYLNGLEERCPHSRLIGAIRALFFEESL